MLFYHFDMLDNFIKNDLIRSLKKEQENIQQILMLYDNKKSNLLAITNNMIEITDAITKNNLEHFYETVSLLKNCFEQINNIIMLSTKLSQNIIETIGLYDKGLEMNKEEIKANLVEYNMQKDELSHKILAFENKNTSIMNSAISLCLTLINKKAKNKNMVVNNINTQNDIKVDIELEPHDHNILIISEKTQKAYLPFFYCDIEKIFLNSNKQYKTLQDVINNLYVLPLSKFNNSSMARFRESFYLIRHKENGSITKALALGLELMFQYNLNPIIIAACRNLDELDIYLDCLNENELDEFSCFEIKFEISPQIKKKDTFLF